MAQSLTNILALNPIHLPPSPSWWPLAWGWISLVGCIFVALLLIYLIIRWRIKRIAPKKTALRLLNPTHGKLTPSDAIELVRQAAFCYFPRKEIAHLTGQEWYAFLDKQFGKPLFLPNALLWQQTLYQHTHSENEVKLIDDCYQWIQHSLPPKKRR